MKVCARDKRNETTIVRAVRIRVWVDTNGKAKRHTIIRREEDEDKY